jgi:DNA-binding beta-propeller fold protein YncE
MGIRKDFLFIGDERDNTVKRFNPITGEFLNNFVVSGSGGLNGPRGLLYNSEGNLLVSNQNVDVNDPGNVLLYNGKTGAFIRELVSSEGCNAAFAPRGIILSNNNSLFVADFLDINNQPGELREFNGSTGEFLRNLLHPDFFAPFFPRGVVIGPHDGLLYVSVMNIFNGLDGWVLRFNPETGEYLGEFITSSEENNLHRPEGLVWGPDGNLYVTSFLGADPSDVDKILIFNQSGELIDQIELYTPGAPRAFAQAILFGPNGKLYVPITGPFDQMGQPAGVFTGSVRVYNVGTKMFDEIVPPFLSGGPLGVPWYLTFRNTDHATLTYME